MPAKRKKLIIIDSNSIIHRAYHALPPLSTKKGELVNAVYGFLLVFLKVIKEFNPDYMVAAFDFPAPTFRHKKYKKYKAKRPSTPKELYQQIPRIKEFLRAFNVCVFEKEGFEADDIIGTVAKSVPKGGINQKIIISGDLDSLQLIDGDTSVYSLRRGIKDIIIYNEDLVKEKYQGLLPNQLLDFKAMRGDPSDNIPGVKGIGEKTAIELVSRFGSLENIYKTIERSSKITEEISPKLKETLLKYRNQALLSRELAKLEENVPISFSLEECACKDYNKEEVIKLLKNFEFYSLIKRLPNLGAGKIVKENLKLW